MVTLEEPLPAAETTRPGPIHFLSFIPVRRPYLNYNHRLKAGLFEFGGNYVLISFILAVWLRVMVDRGRALPPSELTVTFPLARSDQSTKTLNPIISNSIQNSPKFFKNVNVYLHYTYSSQILDQLSTNCRS